MVKKIKNQEKLRRARVDLPVDRSGAWGWREAAESGGGERRWREAAERGGGERRRRATGTPNGPAREGSDGRLDMLGDARGDIG